MTYPDGLCEEVAENITRVENIMGMRFGDSKRPLLLSIYASCSPYRVTVARLAAAQEAVKKDLDKRLPQKLRRPEPVILCG